MRLIDEQFLKTPSYGSRQMMATLRRSGENVNRKRVQRLMALMGLEAGTEQRIRFFRTFDDRGVPILPSGPSVAPILAQPARKTVAFIKNAEEPNLGASFDRESSATGSGRTVSAELSAYRHPAQHAVKCAEEPPTRIVSWQS